MIPPRTFLSVTNMDKLFSRSVSQHARLAQLSGAQPALTSPLLSWSMVLVADARVASRGVAWLRSTFSLQLPPSLGSMCLLSPKQLRSYTKLIQSTETCYVVPMSDPVAILAESCDAILWSSEGEDYGKFSDEETGTTFCVLQSTQLAKVRDMALARLQGDDHMRFEKDMVTKYTSLVRKAAATPEAAKALLESEFDKLSPKVPKSTAVSTTAPPATTNPFEVLARDWEVRRGVCQPAL